MSQPKTSDTSKIPDAELIELLELHVGVLIFNKELEIVYFNQKALAFFKKKFDEDCQNIHLIHKLPQETYKFVVDYFDKVEKSTVKMVQEVEHFQYEKWETHQNVAQKVELSYFVSATLSKEWRMMRIESAHGLVKFERRTVKKIRNRKITLQGLIAIIFLINLFTNIGLVHYRLIDERILNQTFARLEKYEKILQRQDEKIQFLEDSLRNRK